MTSSESCVFCRIVSGQIPCLRVLEDDAILAFLDIGPLAEGHLLVIPKGHYERVESMPAEVLSRLAQAIPGLARALLAVSGAGAYNILANVGRDAGQEVMHVHFHLIPRRPGDGLGYRWLAKKYEGDRGRQLAEQFARALRGE